MSSGFKRARVYACGARVDGKPSATSRAVIGPSNVASIYIDNIPTTSLLDTGSTVSTVSEDFYKQNLNDTQLCQLDSILDITSAGGHSLPYLGYIEAEIKIPEHDVTIPGIFLVVPSTQYHSQVPALLGTNLLKNLKHGFESTYGVQYLQNTTLSASLQLAFRSMNIEDKSIQRSDGKICSLHASSRDRIIIPPNSSTSVPCFLGKSSLVHTQCLVMTEWSQDSATAKDLDITPQLLNYTPELKEVSVVISNPTSSNIVIAPKEAVCQLQVCTVVTPETPESSQDSTRTVNHMNLIDWSKCNVSASQLETIQRFVSEWPDIFSQHDTDLGLSGIVKHSIHLDDERPFKTRYHTIPRGMYDEVRKHLKELLDAKVIRKSHSPWASNMVLAKKKDNSLRLCVDFRKLNARTLKDAYALPRISDILDSLSGSKYFSVLDMKSGYHQIEIMEQHKQRTAFTAGPLGFFEYHRMPFGLTNSPATYQRLMEEIIGDLNHNICEIYIDDIIIYSSTYEEHLDRLHQVFSKFREAGMKLSPKKCSFVRNRVQYVGHIVSSDGISTDPEKTRKVAEWPIPTNVDEVRSFLGFCGYYRSFIKDFSKIVRPLNSLLAGHGVPKKSRRKATPKTTKKTTWKWTDEEQTAFDKIKELLTSPPILAYPDYQKPFVLHTDASMDGLGAVLCQEIDGKERVISYASRGLSKSERHYCAYKLEFLALKWAVVHKFHDYLYGYPFVVLTDNNPLTYVMNSARLDATGHRWLSALAAFNFNIKYRAGKSNMDADALSRLPGLTSNSPDVTEMSTDSVKQICSMLDHQPCVLSLCQMHVEDGEDDEQLIDYRLWRQRQHSDPIIDLFLNALIARRTVNLSDCTTKESRQMLKEWNKFTVQRGVLFRSTGKEKQLQLVLPPEWRPQAMSGVHDDIGHLGHNRGLTLLRDRFYWPNMSADLKSMIKLCRNCLLRKARPEKSCMVPIISSQPLELVTMDYLSLETSKGGHSSILVITDHFTKYAVAVPTRNQLAKTTAESFFHHFIVHYGFPKRIHSDQGTNFEGKLIKHLCQLSGMTKSRTSPYHPQGNGVCERFNRTLLSMLGTLSTSQKSDWKSYVAPMVHAYNCTRHDSTGFSPYELMFGRKPRLALDIALGLVNEETQPADHVKYVEELKDKLHAAYRLAVKHTDSASNRQKLIYDKKCRAAILDVGDRVLVKITAYDGKHKLANKWEEEPYIVKDIPCKDVPVYTVQRETGQGPRRTLHRNLLLPLGSIPLGQETHTDQASEQESSEEQQYRSEEETDDHYHVVRIEQPESSSDEDTSVSESPHEDTDTDTDTEPGTESQEDSVQEEEEEEPPEPAPPPPQVQERPVPPRKSGRTITPPARYADYEMEPRRPTPRPRVSKLNVNQQYDQKRETIENLVCLLSVIGNSK